MKRRYPHLLIYEQIVAERLFDPVKEAQMARHRDDNGDGIPDHMQIAATESAELPDGHDYVYTDPAHDPAWPHITDHTDDTAPDCFPDTWSSEPTERDQAAIDAGNA
ncbi:MULTISPECIES: hypothetical protein [Pseudonocardia]|uniref:Uncharacterized protein n=2 Tax=Pseudonocardia TaxID=1847 RepID=A0A1Y2N636_PSEAH|nr:MULTISPECIES: hypothetical protein [Pseudonocardia]OSY42935.1 hypothetical protein BG845_01177 [Pseudonocardia autotrophica]TDN77511.1 hypothetical protein C8E95_6759 [Pseudonocardia autotrophica]BBG01536.1 hypothetical protein Pdca_27450 [Pseudonocardia autotrophica]GEC25320.1 hypothetical protein PSA01_23490 [Pseudonocardia saturnea]